MVDPRPARVARLLAGVLAAALCLGTAPAFAAKEVIKDTRHDVVLIDASADPNAAPTPAPDQAASDITRTVIAHRAHRLVARVHWRGPVQAKQFTILIIATPATEYMGQFGIGGRHFIMADAPVKCRGVQNSFDSAKSLASISIPRRCLGNPRWVRVRVGTFGRGSTRDEIYLDDARHQGIKPGLVLANGPRLRKG